MISCAAEEEDAKEKDDTGEMCGHPAKTMDVDQGEEKIAAKAELSTVKVAYPFEKEKGKELKFQVEKENKKLDYSKLPVDIEGEKRQRVKVVTVQRYRNYLVPSKAQSRVTKIDQI